MQAAASLHDRERKALGRRWLPGIVSLFLATLAAFAVLCLHFPEWLTTPELRALYPMGVVRTAIAGGIAVAAARDKNFAVHFPWIDRLFGTRFLPADAWPACCGVLEGAPPPGFAAQLLWPFGRQDA